MSVKHLYSLVVVAAILGCASGGSKSAAEPSRYSSKKPDVVTAAEIVAANADIQTAYDALARLRPNWLVGHGVTSFSAGGTEFATVYVDGQKYGDVNSLRSIQAFHVADVHYYDVTQAGARFGLRGGVGGVIEVRTK